MKKHITGGRDFGSSTYTLAEVQQRKSPWYALLIPACFALGFCSWLCLFGLVWKIHLIFYPAHNLKLFWKLFGNDGIGLRSFFFSFLMVVPLMPAGLCLGFIMGNCIFYMIPSARRSFDSEAVSNPDIGFRKAVLGLLQVLYWALPCGLFISIIAAYCLNSLR